MTTSTDHGNRGQKRAESGIKRASLNHGFDIVCGTIRFLDALLSSPTGCATLDDATPDLQTKHADGGKWRAIIPKRLLSARLIVAERVVKSSRTARHAGYLTEWRLIDRLGAEELRADLVAELKERRPAGQQTLPGFDQFV